MKMATVATSGRRLRFIARSSSRPRPNQASTIVANGDWIIRIRVMMPALTTRLNSGG